VFEFHGSTLGPGPLGTHHPKELEKHEAITRFSVTFA